MGYILEATCVCGFTTKIFSGRGFYSKAEHFLPAYCGECHELVRVDYKSNNPKCPSCGEKPMFYGESDFELMANPPDQSKMHNTREEWYRVTFGRNPPFAGPITGNSYLCPKCNNKTLVFDAGGNWD